MSVVGSNCVILTLREPLPVFLAKVGHEGLDVVAATTWLVKRVLQQHVRRSEFIHDIQVAGLAPKISKPAT
jgi:hypothetical protein